MNKRFTITSCTAIIVAAMVFYFLFTKINSSDKSFLELSQASIWSELQTIEFNHRLRHFATPMLLKNAISSKKYDVLGLSGNNKKYPYVWIVLNINAGPNGIYSLPHDEGFMITCKYLKLLASTEYVDHKVLGVLRSTCLN